MSSPIPTPAEVQAALQPLGHAQLHRLAALSGVSFTTLWTIRSGKRDNPGIDTVRRFLALIPEVAGQAA